MANRMKSSYCLLVLAFLLVVQMLLFAVSMSVGQTQARYAQTMRFNTVMYSQTETVTSDCLVSEGKQIILLGSEAQAQFTLLSARDTTTIISWSVSSENVAVKFYMSEQELTSGSTVQLEAGTAAVITMELTGTVSETVNITVVCGELYGIFRAELTGDQETEDIPTEEPDAEEPDTEEPTDPENPPEAEEPADPEELPVNTENEPETVQEETDSEPEAQTENTEETETTEIPESYTESSQTPDEEEGLNTGLQMTTLPEFEEKGYLPVVITSDGKDKISLNVSGNAFPKFTRYTVDNGQTWYLLYAEDDILLDAAEKTVLLIDFSQADLTGVTDAADPENPEDVTTLTLTAAQNDKSCSVTAAVIPEITLPETAPILTKRFDLISEDEIQADTATAMELVFPLSWNTEWLSYTVEILCEDENGQLVYQKVTPDESTLYAKIETAETGNKLIVAMGEKYPPAGTYRLTCNWNFEGICYKETQITFFINYSTFSDVQYRGAEQ